MAVGLSKEVVIQLSHLWVFMGLADGPPRVNVIHSSLALGNDILVLGSWLACTVDAACMEPRQVSADGKPLSHFDPHVVGQKLPDEKERRLASTRSLHILEHSPPGQAMTSMKW